MTTPAITLTATLQDVSGNDIGSAAQPAQMRIALAGFGSQIPRIAGTSVLARVGPIYVPATGTQISTLLWGNDAITPAGTWYDIALLDQNGNVVQAGLYSIAGSGTVDLSNLAPLVSAALQPPVGQLVEYSFVAGANGTTFNLPSLPIAGAPVWIFLRRQKLSKSNGDYNVLGARVTITLAGGYYAGDLIDVEYWQS